MSNSTPSPADDPALIVQPDPRLVCAPGPTEPAPRVGLIIVGDEILSGKRQDKHLAKCIALLAERGMALAWAEYLGDDRERIAAALARAFASGDVVLSTGGIGATPDDHTRQAAAQALGVPLALHPQAKLLIEARMRETAAQRGEPYEPDRPDNVHRLNMGVFPQRASLVPNPYNRIPGFSYAGQRGGSVHFFPGFPVMAWPMMAWVLDHYCAALQRRATQAERSVIVLSGQEGQLTAAMEAVEAAHPGIKVFSLPSVDHPEWGAHIELGVKGAPQVVDAAYADLRQRLRVFDLRYGPELAS